MGKRSRRAKRRERRHDARLASGKLVEISRGWMTLHVKPAVVEAHRQAEVIRSAAAARGCGVVISTPRNGLTYTLHVQFNSWATGRRALDWWPGSGTWRNPETGATGKAADWRAVVGLLPVFAEQHT
jgi:hypothetical protein